MCVFFFTIIFHHLTMCCQVRPNLFQTDKQKIDITDRNNNKIAGSHWLYFLLFILFFYLMTILKAARRFNARSGNLFSIELTLALRVILSRSCPFFASPSVQIIYLVFLVYIFVVLLLLVGFSVE